MPLEVDALEYLFRGTTGSEKPETASFEGGGEGELFSKFVTAVPSNTGTQVKPILLPFRYHPLNDWESLFWVSLYMVIDRVVKPKDNQPQQPSDKLEKQRELARGLFYSRNERPWMFSQPVSGRFMDTLLNCLHDYLTPIATILEKIRIALLSAYREVEAKPDQHPDARVSIDIIMKTIPLQYNAMGRILDAQDITVERLPVWQGLKMT